LCEKPAKIPTPKKSDRGKGKGRNATFIRVKRLSKKGNWGGKLWPDEGGGGRREN